MPGFTFMAPLFLAGLAALSVPIILHLMSREMPRRLVFPTIRHIFKGQRLHAGRRGLRDLLTLLMRLALLALVVLLFAEPVWRRTAADAAADAQEIVLFLDLSASLQAVPYSSFIKKHVGEILSAHPEARIGLIASSNRIEQRLALSPDHSGIQGYLMAVQPTPLPGNHYAALQEVEGLFSRRDGVDRKLLIFTDLQQQDWSPAGLPRLPEGIDITIVNPHPQPPANVAILSAFPEVFVRGQQRRLRATVQLRNFSLRPTSVNLTLQAGSTEVVREVALRSDYTEKFVLDLESPDGNIASAAIDSGEGYQLDNAYTFWIGPQPPLKVAVVIEPKADRAKGIELFFLRSALTTSLPGLEKYEVIATTPDYFWDQDMRQFRCVFLLDTMHAFSELETEQLREYVEAGGILVYFAGHRLADNLSRLNHARLSQTRFLSFIGEIGQLRTWSVNQVAPGAAIVDLFAEEPSDLRYFPIYRFGKVSAPESARVLLGLDKETPLLIAEDVGKGVTFLMTIGLSPTWSELPTSLCFLPLLRQLVEYDHASRSRPVVSAEVGEDYSAALIDAGVVDPGELPNTAGVHVVGNIPVELNYTRAESDPREAEALEVEAQLLPLLQAATAGDASADDATVNSLRVPLAWALLAFVFLELLAANLRQRRREASATPA